MNDEQRDPDLEWIRSHWKAPEPSVSLATRVLANYNGHVGATSRKRWVWWVPVAAAAFLAFIMLSKPDPADHYRAVAQPRFVVVSQGEHP